MSTGKRTIEFTLNGRAVSADVAPHWNMVEMLQGAFGMTGARESCGQGLCGCCTVLIDGEAVTGCLQLATLVDGKSVETVEGGGLAAAPPLRSNGLPSWAGSAGAPPPK